MEQKYCQGNLCCWVCSDSFVVITFPSVFHSPRKPNKCIHWFIFALLLLLLLSSMEAPSDKVQLQGGGESRGGGDTREPSGSEVWGRRARQLADQAHQTQTLRVQGQQERPYHEGGASHSRIHRNVQVLLYGRVSARWPDLLSACVRTRWAQMNESLTVPCFLLLFGSLSPLLIPFCD